MKFIDRIKVFVRRPTRAQIQTREVLSLNDPKLVEYLTSKEEIAESIFSVISRVSNVMASLPLKMIDNDYQQPNDCTAFNLLSDGPRYFTRFDFFRDIEALRNYQGNAYVQVFKNTNGQIIDMALIKPGACYPIIDSDTGELYYQVTAKDNKNYSNILYVHYMEMLHFKHTRFGGIEGTDPTKVLTNTLNFDREVRRISLTQLNGTNEGLKVKFAANMDEDGKEAVIKNIAKFYKENGGLLVEENGVEIERLTRELVDSKLLDTDKISRSRVATVYTVPEHFVGGGQSSYSSQEQLNMEFLTYNLVPTVNQYEEELNKKTLTPQDKKKGYRYKFNVSSLLRADTQSRGNFYQIMRRNGAYTANDVLRYEDMVPSNEEGMNDHHISGDLYPINMAPTLRKSTQSVVKTD
ncbi:phage portal protein [Enterococcus hulanensis]|uniref:phage portal protein n=1 Tax=Enterococcus hulanensis TaxID=2559929 RepID=UPI00288D7702|nr:phage portal protein [Enterococcus hulanensis]MDT2660695.1 phage portal protein [Enterococcus hulanensis]